MSKRAERRHKAQILKKRAKRIIRGWRSIYGNEPKDEKLDPRAVGKVASVHGAACSCRMCGNPRKWGEKTMQEIKQDLKDQINED